MNGEMTLGRLLTDAGAKLRIFDLGRRVTKIAPSDFEKFEQARLRYPFPRLQQAWFAVLFWDRKVRRDPFIWFLRFPLDEQGLLQPAARDDFLQRLIDALGHSLTAPAGDGMERALAGNPYAFRPKPYPMAVFHAKANRALGHAPSSYFEPARDYFTGQNGWERWESLGLQGIADLVVRLDKGGNAALLEAAIPELPDEPLAALGQCLAHEAIPQIVARALAVRLERQLAGKGATGAITSCLLGLSNTRAKGVRQQAVQAFLESPHADQLEPLTAIAASAWEVLEEPALARLYMERLAASEAPAALFDETVTDLLFIPGMREPLLDAIRSPERSARLSERIGGLFHSVGTGETATLASG